MTDYKARQKVIKRPEITDEQLHLELINCFNQGVTVKGQTYELLRTKFAIEKQRTLKAHPSAFKVWNEIKTAATLKATAENTEKEIEALIWQRNKSAHELQKMLETGKVKDTIFSKLGGAKEIQRNLRPMEYVAIRNELNKMLGFHAATKSEVKIDGSEEFLQAVAQGKIRTLSDTKKQELEPIE